MKIKVNEKIAVGVKITQKMVCPAGTAYYSIDYMYESPNGEKICVHSAGTGAIYGEPNPIAMLDRTFSWSEPHFQDIPDPDRKPEGEAARGRKICVGRHGGRNAWWDEREKTHRQAIIDAVAQIVEE